MYYVRNNNQIQKINLWFLDKIQNIVKMEKRLAEEELTKELIFEAKRLEFPDEVIAKITADFF